ncbi:MAG: hypothetical protein JO081_08310 [Alphaproteobacteria bacterium]|nr:hypothetical protein [Alphaproteobacteria bacterium]
MDLQLRITALADTTPREISALSSELRSILERSHGVEHVVPLRVAAPDGAKGVFVDALGGLAVSVAPVFIKTLLQTLQSVLSRQPAATKVLIETKHSKFAFEFDPKKTSLQELVAAAERLSAVPSSV